MLNQELFLKFGDIVISIRCNAPQLQEALHRCFQSCLAFSKGEENPAATYFLNTLSEGKLALQRGDELLYRGGSPALALERLMHEGTMTLAAQCRERLVFHAAGLAYGDEGLIFCGSSGSGKSTLAAQLITAGFDYLSDELVAIRFDAGEMSGFTRPLVLKAGSAFVWQEGLAEIAQENLLQFTNGTTLLDPELLRLHAVRVSASPRLLLFSRYQVGQPFTAQPLSKAKAVFELMQGLLNAKNLPQGGLVAITQLARQVPVYRLTYNHFSQVVAWLEQQLAQ